MSQTYIPADLRRQVRERAVDRCEYEDRLNRPLTQIGRATERLLKLNLPERVDVRETLAKARRYPG